MEIVYHTFLVFARVDYYLVALSKSEFFLKPLAEAKQRRGYTGGSETGSAGRHITQATQTCRSLKLSIAENVSFRECLIRLREQASTKGEFLKKTRIKISGAILVADFKCSSMLVFMFWKSVCLFAKKKWKNLKILINKLKDSDKNISDFRGKRIPLDIPRK